MRFALACCLSAAIAPSALAQYNITLYGMPDFDQRRSALPNDGAAYCAPTAATDLLAYATNHGLPSLMNGPRNWQLQQHYDDVTFALLAVGSFMETDPVDGTTGAWHSGLSDFVDASVPGKFTVTATYVTPQYSQVTPFWMYVNLFGGGLVTICYGRYELQGDMTWDRVSGHCVAINGVHDANQDPAEMRWRNPGGGDSDLTQQSLFATSIFDVTPDTLTTGSGDFWMWEILTSATDGQRRFMDGYLTLKPTFVLTPSNTGVVAFLKPFKLTSDPGPIETFFQPPPGLTFKSVAIHPDQSKMFALAADASGLLRTMLVPLILNESYVQIDQAPGTDGALCTSRHGDIYIATNSTASPIRVLHGETGALLGDLVPPAPVSSMDYNDDNDTLALLVPSQQKVLIAPRLLGAAVELTFPSTLVLGASPSIAVGGSDSPFDGRYLVRGTTHIYQLAPEPGTRRLILEEAIQVPGVPSPTGFAISDIGSLIVSDGIRLVEVIKTGGTWGQRPGSDFTGMPSGPRIALSRSRSNFDPALHRDWNFVIDNPPGREEVDPRCPADFDGDGDLGTDADIEAFFACLAGNCCALCGSADFNGDGDLGTDADIEAFFRVLAGGPC